MLKTVKTIKLNGVNTVPVQVECRVEKAAGGPHIVGLVNSAVKETLLRTLTAIQSCGYRFVNQKCIINLAPTDLIKTEQSFGLPIALSYISATGQEDLPDLDRWLVMGEVGLDGGVRSVPGLINAVLYAREQGLKGCIIPSGEEKTLALFAEGVEVHCVATLKEAVAVIKGASETLPLQAKDFVPKPDSTFYESIRGNESALRAIEIAAAGGHHILLVGAPGSQKSTIAKAFNELLPDMSKEEALEVSRIYSSADRGQMVNLKRPFRAPHYTASVKALFGGGLGTDIHPGEITLAHNGVLFLDEFNCIPKAVLEGLRAPLEDGKKVFHRDYSTTEYPASFILVGAMNPCPCGYYGEGERCSCTPGQRMHYLERLYGPVYDRTLIQTITRVPTFIDITNPPKREPFEEVREKIRKARAIQAERFKDCPYKTNDGMPMKDIERFCRLSPECKKLIDRIMERMSFSARAYSRIIIIARTIADLEGKPDIMPVHLAEATAYRFLDRRI